MEELKDLFNPRLDIFSARPNRVMRKMKGCAPFAKFMVQMVNGYGFPLLVSIPVLVATVPKFAVYHLCPRRSRQNAAF